MNAAADPGVGSVYTLHAVVRHCNLRVGQRTLLYCTRFYFTFAATCSTITYFGPGAERFFIMIIFYHISPALYSTEKNLEVCKVRFVRFMTKSLKKTFNFHSSTSQVHKAKTAYW